ncbi:MAG: hypothetical protein ACREJC_15615 [Tepidisphaeraceae bacterium]
MNTRALQLCVVLTLALATLSRAQTPTATLDELRKMYDARQYRVCLQQIAKVLRGADRGGSNRFDLLTLRGDCLLQLRDGATAKDAYAAAQKSPDIQQAAYARAMNALIRHSPGLQYTPQGGGPPISILDDNMRKQAMEALFNDQFQSRDREFHRAAAGNDLEAIKEVLPTLMDLYSLEVTATGKTDQIAPVFRAVGQEARSILERQLQLIDQKEQSIENACNQTLANPTVNVGSEWWLLPGVVRRGLMPDERDTLREIIYVTPRIQDAAEHGQRVASALGGQPEAWDAIITKAGELRERAASILDME